MKAYVYAAVAAAALALVVVGAYRVRASGFEAGKASCETAHAIAAAKAQVEVARREVVSADASTSMLDYLAANLPATEVRTHETVERIRTVYRDRTAPAGCFRPDGVLDTLEAARQRANAAAGRL